MIHLHRRTFASHSRSVYEVACSVFNCDAKEPFRPIQKSAIDVAMSKQSLFLHLPTGAGKSLCYQLPAVLSKKATIIVSPLISLIQDQMEGLKRYGIPNVRQLTGQLNAEEKKLVLKAIQTDRFHSQLIYTTPETLVQNELFRQTLRQLVDHNALDRIVVDEAHCITEWGSTFRQAYIQMCHVLQSEFPGIPLTLLTASASEEQMEKIKTLCGLDHLVVLKHLFDRPNLTLRVLPKDKQTLFNIAHTLQNHHAIVYTMTQKEAEFVAKQLVRFGRRAAAYHGGLSHQKRKSIQKQWSARKIDIICATVAFGMGIDALDVKYVVHYSIPLSLSNYYQEIGRAGRNGDPAECILFFKPTDRFRAAHVVSGGDGFCTPTTQSDLEEVIQYCTATECRRQLLFEAVGGEFDPKGCCRACNCGLQLEFEEEEEEEEAVVKRPPVSVVPKAQIEYLFHRIQRLAKKDSIAKRDCLSRKVIGQVLQQKPATEMELAQIKGVGEERAALWYSVLAKEFISSKS